MFSIYHPLKTFIVSYNIRRNDRNLPFWRGHYQQSISCLFSLDLIRKKHHYV